MSSFGRVRYERSQYRRRNCGSVFPADARFGLIGEFWSPLAARQGSLSLSLVPVPVKDCEGVVPGTGRDAAVGDGAEQPCDDDGSAWDVVQDGALEAIRIEEGIPAEAVTMAVAVDGSMLGMRKEKGAPGQGMRHGRRASGRRRRERFRCTMQPEPACVRCATAGCRRPGKCP